MICGRIGWGGVLRRVGLVGGSWRDGSSGEGGHDCRVQRADRIFQLVHLGLALAAFGRIMDRLQLDLLV